MRPKFFNQYFIGLILMLVAFAGGFWFGRAQNDSFSFQQTLTENKADLGLFWEAWQKIEEKYILRSNLDVQKMIYGAISGMVKSLGDPYTVFMPPEEAEKFQNDLKGSFEGIGAEIGIRKEVLTIIAPLEGTPAQKAGLKPKDQILKIDSRDTADLTIDEAVSLIRGPKGTTVTLTIFNNESISPKEVKIVRETIKVPVLNLSFKEDNIAYLRLYHFNENAGEEFKKAVGQILNSGSKKLILDLRNNPGGYLETSVEIASFFLSSGQIVAIEDFGGRKIEYKSKGYQKFKDFGIAVLVNEGSASASEILAGALRDNLGVKLIGQKTFGKGSVQELEALKGGSSLKVTVAKWLTPSGKSIMEEGLEPDVKIEITGQDNEAGRDPQLDKAMEMLK